MPNIKAVLGWLIKNLGIDFLKEAKNEEKTRKKLQSADKDVQSFREEKKEDTWNVKCGHKLIKIRKTPKSSRNAHWLCKRD